MNQQLTDWVTGQLRQGTSKEEVKQMLKNEGWQDHDIDHVFSDTHPQISKIPTPPEHRATRLIGPWQLIKKTLSVYKSNWKTFLGIYFLPAIATIAAVAVMAIVIFPSSGTFRVVSALIFFVLIIAIIINFSGWIFAALLHATKNREQKPGIKESYRQSKSLRFLMLGITIATGFIVLGGTMLFIIPGIIFFVSFMFATCVLSYENIKGMDALMKSREYVRGMWWGVFGRFLIFEILLMIAVYGIPGILGVLNDTLGNISTFIVSILSAPITYIFTALLYENLRDIKGTDIIVTAKKSRFILSAVLGILIIPLLLVAFVSLGLSKSIGTDKDVARVAHLNLIKSEAELYYFDYGRYPASLSELIPYGQKYGQNSIPVDPETKEPYRYTVTSTGDDYKLCATMEAKTESCVEGTGSSL